MMLASSFALRHRRRSPEEPQDRVQAVDVDQVGGEEVRLVPGGLDQLLIDAATVERLHGVPVHEIGRIEVRGFSEPAAVFAPTAETSAQLRLTPGRSD